MNKYSTIEIIDKAFDDLGFIFKLENKAVNEKIVDGRVSREVEKAHCYLNEALNMLLLSTYYFKKNEKIVNQEKGNQEVS